MRVVLIVLVFFCFFAQAKDLVDTYRYQGIDEVEKKIQKYLQSKNYWYGRLKEIDTKYGFYERLDSLILCQKKSKKVVVLKKSKNGFKSVDRYKAIVGKMGQKRYEGDLVTPIGVYDITKKFRPKDRFYGPLAFALSYPNLYDKSKGRKGHGIWIHGYPLDGSSRNSSSKGCVVIKNSSLKSLEKKIDHSKSVIIISQNSYPSVKKETLANILANLYKWQDAWKRSDFFKYIAFYDKDFRRYDGMKLSVFKMMKKRIFRKKEKKSIKFMDINIYPYPSLKEKNLFRVTFLEDYKAPSYKFRGNKELIVKADKRHFKILVER